MWRGWGRGIGAEAGSCAGHGCRGKSLSGVTLVGQELGVKRRVCVCVCTRTHICVRAQNMLGEFGTGELVNTF